MLPMRENPTLRLGPMIRNGTVKRVFLNKRVQSRLSTNNDSVMSDDGESDE
jgi:hypothetical protein